MTQIDLLTDSNFHDRIRLQLIVIARQAIAGGYTQEEKEYFKEVLRSPNDGGRVNNYATLICSQIDIAAWDAAGTENQKNNMVKQEIVKVYKEAAKL